MIFKCCLSLIIVELLGSKDVWGKPKQILQNLVTHQSKNVGCLTWLSIPTSICIYISMPGKHQREAPLPRNSVHTCTSLILDIHAMLHCTINWQLSNQVIRWTISHDHIAGSDLELIEAMCFWKVDLWPGTGSQLDCRLKPGYRLYFGEGGSTCKKQIWVQINPWHVFESSDILFAQSSLGKSLIYWVHNF